MVDKSNSATYHKVRFKTLTKEIFNEYHNIFYKSNVKILPSNIKDLLKSELALAVWYLDDGALRTDCRALRIHTNNFTYNEVVVLQDVLLVNYKIHSQIHKQGKTYNLYIGSINKQSDKFCNLIRPVIASKIPSMVYKLLKPCND